MNTHLLGFCIALGVLPLAAVAEDPLLLDALDSCPTDHDLPSVTRSQSTVHYDDLVIPLPAGEPVSLHAHGLLHTAVGQAAMELAPDGSLVISNLSPSGQDGVKIAMTMPRTHTLTFIAPLSAKPEPDGSVLELTIETAESGALGTVTATDIGSAFEIIVDYSPIGAQTHTLRLIGADCEMIFDLPGYSAPQFVPDAPESIATSLLHDGNVCIMFMWNDPRDVTVPGHGVVSTSRMMMLSEAPPDPAVITEARFGTCRFLVLPGGTPTRTIISESLTQFGQAHRTLGQAHMSSTTDDPSLLVSNITSSGEDGVVLSGPDDIVVSGPGSPCDDLYHSIGFDYDAILAPASGASFSYEALGHFAGKPDHSVWQSTLMDVGGSLRLSVSYPIDLAAPLAVQAILMGAIQDVRPVASDGLAATILDESAWPASVTVTPRTLAKRIGAGVPVQLPEGPVVTADELRIIAPPMAAEAEALESLRIAASDIDAFIIGGENVIPIALIAPPLAVDLLPEGDGTASRCWALLSSPGAGTFAAGEVQEDGVWKAVVWEHSPDTGGWLTPIVLPSLGHGARGRAGLTSDISPGATTLFVAGVVLDAAGQSLPAFWEGEPGGPFPLEILDVLGGGEAVVRSGTVSEIDGTIALTGWSSDAGGVQRAVVWESQVTGGDWTMVTLPDLGFGALGFCDGSHAGGSSPGEVSVVHVGGAVFDVDGDPKPAYWRRVSQGGPFTLTELPPLPVSPPDAMGEAYGMMTSGLSQISTVGWATGPGGVQRPVRWRNSDGGEGPWFIEPLGVPEGFDVARAQSVSAEGATQYISGRAESGAGQREAVLWTRRLAPGGPVTIVNLNDESDTELTLQEAPAVAISAEDKLVIGAYGVLRAPLPQGEAPPHAVAFTEVVEAPSIPGDIDGDGTVGFNDLLILLAAWGPCPAPPDPCPADIDEDGTVGFSDLLILLAHWGQR